MDKTSHKEPEKLSLSSPSLSEERKGQMNGNNQEILQKKDMKIYIDIAKQYVKGYLNCKEVQDLQAQIQSSSSERTQEQTMKLYLELGGLSFRKNQYNAALEAYHKFYEIKKKLGETDDSSSKLVLNRIVETEIILAKYEEARQTLDHHYQPSDLCLKENNNNEVIGTYENIISLLFCEGKSQEALDKVNEYLEYVKKENDIDKMKILEMKFFRVKLYTILSQTEKISETFEPLLEEFRNLTDCLNKASEKAEILNIIGFIYFVLGKYDKSLLYFEDSLKEALRSEDKQFLNVIHLLIRIGNIYSLNGDYPLACDFCLEACNMCEEVFGNTHPLAAVCFACIGTIYGRQCKFQEAEDYLQKSLAIRQSIFQTHHPLIADSYKRIGELYFYMTKYQQAHENYKTALDIYLECYQNNVFHYDIAYAYSDLGKVNFLRRQYVDAQIDFEKCLSVLKNLFGNDHPNVADTYGNISIIFGATRQLDRQLEYLLKVLDIQKRVLEKNHIKMGSTYQNLAHCYSEQGNYDKAIKKANKAIVIRKKAYGEVHPQVSDIYSRLGIIYKRKEDYREAMKYMMRSLKINLKFYPIENTRNFGMLSNLAFLYKKMKNFEEAKRYYRITKLIKQRAVENTNEHIYEVTKRATSLNEQDMTRLDINQNIF